MPLPVTFRFEGKVGIRIEDAGAFTPYVNGAAAKPGGGRRSIPSDLRLRKNIKPLNSPWKNLLTLRGVTIKYN